MIKYRAKPYYKNSGNDYIYGYPYIENVVGSVSKMRKVRKTRTRTAMEVYTERAITAKRYWMHMEIDINDLVSKVMIDKDSLEMNFPDTDYYEGDIVMHEKKEYLIRFIKGCFFGCDKDSRKPLIVLNKII